MDYAFFDIEVYAKDNLVCIAEPDDDWNIIWHDLWDDYPNRRSEIYDVLKRKTLVGYNNYHYDNYIIQSMRRDQRPETIKHWNDVIISDGRAGDRNGLVPLSDFETLDCMQQISVGGTSLKQIEGNIGMSVEESSVPFDISTKLTEEQRAETVKYCHHDVEATMEVFKLRKKSYFDTKAQILQMLPEEDRGYLAKTNTTTISAKVLLEKERSNSMEGKTAYMLPDEAYGIASRLGSGVPAEVWEMWNKIDGVPPRYESTGKEGHAVLDLPKETVTTRLDGCDYVFGFGGLHGAPPKPGIYRNVKLADVGSMYPSIIVALNALGTATAKYDSIRQERLRIKHVDKVKADALKLILNSVYGNLKNKYNPLNAPGIAATVCIYGQIALYTLCTRLSEAGYQVINANTDGVAFTDDHHIGNQYETICKGWEKDFPGLVLEVDSFDKWWQRDVNNYIATQGDHIKTKGGDVNKYDKDKPFDNNSLRIIQRALVDKLVFDTDPLETICENLMPNPLWYQIILKCGSTFEGTTDDYGRMYNKVNRVFAAKPGTGIRLLKKRPDGSTVIFPDSPESMILYNEALTPGCLSGLKIDTDYYYKLAEKKLSAWPKGR